VSVADLVPRDANLAPRDDNLAPRDANLAPRDDNLAPRDANLAPRDLNHSSTQADKMLRRFMRIQYASDLHLEHFDNVAFQSILKPVAPVLALVGDLGQPGRRAYRDLMQYCSRNWTKVFVLAGNHELYHPVKTADELIAECSSIAEGFPNVHFMNRTRVDYAGVTFLGATLWTNLTGHEEVAQDFINDFRRIYINDPVEGKRRIVPTDVTAWHIREELETCQNPKVILTHHLPLCDLIADKYKGHILNPCFATDCTEFIRPGVRALIAGHTHSARQVNWVASDVSLVAGCVNPHGYPGEDTGYSRECVVEIEGVEDHRDPLLVAAAIDDVEDESDFAPAPQSPASPTQN
jgi:hypothetical protein